MNNPKSAQQLMTDNQIVKMYAGSIAYGTNLPTSDVDFRGIFVADPINVRTPFYNVEEVEDSAEEDTKYFELSKFMKLALDCNPNVIELLWTDPKHIVSTSPAYELLRSHAPDLLSTKIAFTTSGYAHGQLSRLMGHHKWINNPQPVDAPQQKQYMSLVHNFTGTKMFKFDVDQFVDGNRFVPYTKNTLGVYPADKYSLFNKETGSLNTDYEGDVHSLGTPNFIVKFNEDVYLAAKEQWKNYWTWKKNRNEKRSLLEEKYSFDTKHAMHCVRLLNMGIETLQTGQVHVLRPDAELLLSIRAGAWNYEQLITYAEDAKKQLLSLVQTSKLPKKPNIKLAAKLIMDVQDIVWNKS